MKPKALRAVGARWRAIGLTVASAMVLWPVQAGSGQVPQQPIPNRPQAPSDVLRDNNQPAGPNPAKLEQMREDDRRKRLLADTAKLVELSNELKTDVENTSKDQLSLDVVRKAAEIEKLAHDVKERMKS